MRDLYRIWRWLKIIAPLISIVLIITVIAAAVADAERQLLAIFETAEQHTLLECDGTYDDENIDLHIYSEDNGIQLAQTAAAAGNTAAAKAVAWGIERHKESKKGKWIYVKYSDGHGNCPLCKPKNSGKGWQCIGYVSACYFHGAGVPCDIKTTKGKYCNLGGLGSGGDGSGRGSLDGSSPEEVYKKWKSHNGEGWQMITSGNLKKGHIPQKDLMPGDVLICYNGSGKSVHMAMYAGDGKVLESSGGSMNNGKGGIYYRKGTWSLSRARVAMRYTGGGETTNTPAGSVDNLEQFSAKSSVTILRTIKRNTGSRYSISYQKGYGVAQSFAYTSDKFAVAFTPGPETKTKGYLRLYDKTGKYLSSAKGDIYHANGTCISSTGDVLVAGSLHSGREKIATKFKVSNNKISNAGTLTLPSSASAIAYDKDTGNYILSVGSSMTVYDKNFTKKRDIKRSMHGAYFQDIGAGGGLIFACHTKTKGGEKSGKNYIDVYGQESGEYYGTYYLNYGELESADVVDGELVILVHIKGSSKNYIQFTGITMQSAGLNAALIDFRVSAKKSKLAGSWSLKKSGISAGDDIGSLNAKAKIKDGRIEIKGKLIGAKMRIKGSAADGKISGSGWVEIKFESSDTGADAQGSATYVGVDDKDTEHSKKVLAELDKWSNSHNPFYNGYGGLCEKWVCDVYSSAGLISKGACCAYRHGENEAKKDGKIPKGALVFSGRKPDGSMYENGHRQSAYCGLCEHWAGHVAIYKGGGMIAGSQVPYLMSVDTWIDIYGYGGWSLR